MTKFSDKKSAQEKARRETVSPESLKLLEGRIRGVEMALAEIHARLDALEVVRVPSPTVDEPQRPETE